MFIKKLVRGNYRTSITSSSVRMSTQSRDEIFWKPSTPFPPELSSGCNPFRSTLIPRTIAWFSVNDEKVSLLDGYTACAYTPPSIIFAAKALPPTFLDILKETKVCTLSSVTAREPESSYKTAYTKDDHSPRDFLFSDLGLMSKKTKQNFPSVVASSPINMFCSLRELVDLGDDEGLVILEVETFVIDGSIQSPPTEEMKRRPGVISKIDAELIKPLVSLGGGNFSGLAPLRSMPRPFKQTDGSWRSTELNSIQPSSGQAGYETVEWTYKVHGGTSPLGYNAVTALVMPRPIGWISTYRKEGRVPHVAPYSFFIDVARGSKPMVAFSGNRPEEGSKKKDAQTDAEEMGFFVYNMVSEELAVPMNYSAAPLERHDSEFELGGIEHEEATLGDAPIVSKAHIRYECKYVRTVNVEHWSIVIGSVEGVFIDRAMVVNGKIDVAKLKPVTRLGYMDEYGLLPGSSSVEESN